MPDQELLDVYLSDHFAGATGGLQLAQRMADSQLESEELGRIAREIEADRSTLEQVMEATGVRTPRLKTALGWVGEKAGRLKLNERVFGRSPLSDVVELETMIAGVSGKLQLWRALSQVAERDTRLARFDFQRLAASAEDQRARLEAVHGNAVRRALRDR